MAVIYMNLKGSLTSGGPTVAAARLASGFVKSGHKVIYDNPEKSNIALCIIETGKVLRKVDRLKTKVAVRLDGAYFKKYWHNKTPDRAWRSDMDALHNAIKRDVASADLMIYQSKFSKEMIDAEIAERKDNFVIINNGVDSSVFKPAINSKNGVIKLFHHGVIRNDYIILSLINTYNILKSRGHNVQLHIIGSMDAVCTNIYKNYKNDSNIKYYGQIHNNALSKVIVATNADIGLYPRQGSSNDNCVIEAMSSAIPVIIPSFGGNADVVDNGISGVLVDSNEWNYGNEYDLKIADAAEQVILNLDEFKKNARSNAENKLSIDTMIKKYLSAFGL